VLRLHCPPLGPRLALIGVGLFSGFLAAGCGSDGPVMGRVSGTVTMIGGEPLTKGTVTFIATDSQRPNATGTIGESGYYTLQTTEPGDGALVGDYKVAISDVDSSQLNTPLPGMPVKVPKSAIAKTYLDSEKSGLTATVEAGSNTKNFEVSKAAAK
jgi:hypothetical protein